MTTSRWQHGLGPVRAWWRDRRRSFAVALFGVVVMVVSGQADAQSPPMAVTAGAGVAFPAGANVPVGDGWNVSVGATFPARAGWAVKVDYIYSRFAPVDRTGQYFDLSWNTVTATLPTTISGRTQSHTGSFDVVYSRWFNERHVLGYVFGGPSIVHRRVTLQGTVRGYLASFCEQQWLTCSPESVPFDQAMGVKNSTDLGANVGFGVSFDVGLKAQVFAETRLVYILGPDYKLPSGTQSGRAQFVPVTVGLRF
jgi:opacity protein-like surface antigen